MGVFEAAPYRSVVDPVIQRLKTGPEQVALIFVHDDESEEQITIRQLHAGAGTYAHQLLEAGIRPGDIVILALRHSLDLIYAFWGALYIGAVPAIIAYKGPMTTVAAYIGRLKDMASHAGARLVLTLPDLEAEAKNILAGPGCRVMSGGRAGNDDFLPKDNTGGEEIAYLQHTSGTTGSQKGVKLSHRAILNQVQSLVASLEISRKDVVVNWLPLYHDFGLFAGLILPLFSAIPAVLVSPFKWLRNPGILLGLIHRHRGTISFMPNSGLHHTVSSLSGQDLSGLDLSSLRSLINGSEPIFYRSQQMFLERFSPHGFKETALATGYGMAENTLGVSFSPANMRSPVDWVSAEKMRTLGQAVPVRADRQGAKANVSSGKPLENMEVAIIDKKGRQLPDRHLGEIVVQSQSLFSGYRCRPDLTGPVMEAGRYRTGDIGYLAGGHLYVCGREKDLIIIGGHNVHPEDLEAIAGTVNGIQADRVVALGSMDDALGTEKIVMICGLVCPATDEEKQAMERELRRRLQAGLEVTLGEVHFVNKNWIERSPNGKIARRANLEKYRKNLAKRLI